MLSTIFVIALVLLLKVVSVFAIFLFHIVMQEIRKLEETTSRQLHDEQEYYKSSEYARTGLTFDEYVTGVLPTTPY